MKHGICLSLLIVFSGFLFCSQRAYCQFVPASQEIKLPDSPSITQATSCTKNNGQPCPEWLHTLIGQYPPSAEWNVQPQRDPSTVHFWTYRGIYDPPLRGNKQVFRSKAFLATHVGAAIAMIVACRTKNSGEEWHSEVPAVAAVFGLDYLQFRFVGGPNAIGGPVYQMVHYGLASVR